VSGFSGAPGGYRDYNGYYYDFGYDGHWWSSSELDTFNAWVRSLDYYDDLAYRGSLSKHFGFSVRCLRD
jgi:uncharacterized protein (TIGR02145 family)